MSLYERGDDNMGAVNSRRGGLGQLFAFVHSGKICISSAGSESRR